MTRQHKTSESITAIAEGPSSGLGFIFCLGTWILPETR